eukprot:TRINITY_DN2998_c0_g1_i1.p1 TRINITY_DN2998_c0_g1~~TRINITY_DN2998_c0_g1_i1.p1  ORF type:complete len:544 (-),score=97.29 TRINITY_DN2998_c0_g1_i1:37-1668(-)
MLLSEREDKEDHSTLDEFFVCRGSHVYGETSPACTCEHSSSSASLNVSNCTDYSSVVSYGSFSSTAAQSPRSLAQVTPDDEEETVFSELVRSFWNGLLHTLGVRDVDAVCRGVPRFVRPVKTGINSAHGFFYRSWFILAEFSFRWSVAIQVVFLIALSIGVVIIIGQMSKKETCWDLNSFSIFSGSIHAFENLDELSLSTSRLCIQAFFVLALCTSFQFVSLILAFSYCVYNLKERIISLPSIGCLFISMVLTFGSAYELCLFMNPNSFDMFSSVDFKDFGLQLIAMLYFSTVTASSVGFGDISPQNVGSSILSTLQMVMSTIFMVVLFGVALSNLRIDLNFVPYPARPPRKRFFARGFLYRNHFIIMMSLTIANLLVLEYIDLRVAPLSSFSFLVAVSTILQILLCFIEIRLLLKVLRSYENRVLSVRFAVKGYVSQALTFAVIYTSMSVFLEGKAFYIGYLKNSSAANLSVWNSVLVYLFFSFTAQTSTGYGNVFPIHAYSQCLVVVQLVFTIVFNIVIFGTCASNVVDDIAERRRTTSTR